MPLIRRVPKRGFTNPFRISYSIVNLKVLEGMDHRGDITPEVMREHGLIKKRATRLKILGEGDVSKALVIHAHKFSKSAQEKIQAAGGRAEVIARA